jgi:type I restriction enzyme M protein
MDDMDRQAEVFGGKPSFFVKEYEKYAWRNLMSPKLGGQERMNLYMEALEKMGTNPNLSPIFRDILKNSYVPYRSPETLNLFLSEIDGFAYDHSEDLGDAFEYLLSIMGAQGDAGQFRTPRHIIDFIVEMVDPKKTDKILDPACGTAGFLISAYKHIQNNNKKENPGDKLSHDERQNLHKNFVGYDISPEMAKLSRVNMFLHNFPDPKIYEYDTLSSEERWADNFDVIIANPPFMSPKGGIIPHKKFRIPANRAEVLFTDYIVEHLKPKGRAGIIVPEGIIFQSANAYKELRKMLVEDGLYAVVSLPAGVFNPYSGVKTSILLFDNSLAKQSKEILFIKIGNDGYDLGSQRRAISKNDLPEALRILNGWKEGKKIDSIFAVWVEKTKIAEGGEYNLSSERYHTATDYSNAKWPMFTIGELCELYNGKAFKPSDWKKKSSGGLPIIRIQNLNNPKAEFNYFDGEFDEKILVENGDLLFSWSGSRGTSFGPHIWSGSNAILNQHIFKVVHRDEILRGYFYLALKESVKEVEENLHGGVGLVHITKGNLERIKIPVPPLEIQKQIVTELDGYQNIITGAKQVVVNWKPSFIVDPKWEKVKIHQICEIERGASPRPIENFITEDPNGCNWVKIGDTKHAYKYITKTAEKITKEGAEKSRKVFIGDFVLSNSMSFGHPYIMKIEGYIHDGWLRLSEDAKKIGKDYLYYVLSSDIVMEQFEAVATGGVVRNLNSELVKNVEIPLPPLEMQKQIVERIEAERVLIEGNKKIIEIYEQKTKDTLSKLWVE